jgi:hypothetical protein
LGNRVNPDDPDDKIVGTGLANVTPCIRIADPTTRRLGPVGARISRGGAAVHEVADRPTRTWVFAQRRVVNYSMRFSRIDYSHKTAGQISVKGQTNSTGAGTRNLPNQADQAVSTVG